MVLFPELITAETLTYHRKRVMPFKLSLRSESTSWPRYSVERTQKLASRAIRVLQEVDSNLIVSYALARFPTARFETTP